MNCQQIPELNTFFVKPLENDENYNQGTLIFTYTILIEIIRSNFHYKNATYDKKYENLIMNSFPLILPFKAKLDQYHKENNIIKHYYLPVDRNKVLDAVWSLELLKEKNLFDWYM